MHSMSCGLLLHTLCDGLSVCLLDTSMSLVKTSELIEVPFGVVSQVGRRNHLSDGGPHPLWEGTIFYEGDRAWSSQLLECTDHFCDQSGIITKHCCGSLCSLSFMLLVDSELSGGHSPDASTSKSSVVSCFVFR